ncbi:CBO0543 family protein [Thermaerobacillus caldiproteolyticus]|uniref:CBO0543 family protein n=1 Tax=Thermaerobacillus caldiproteolyticus TaxID=247480 RepID=UPI001F2437A3|nr:CBO0543 family protein [Anoxybacillus caldiproteolyticus]
MDRIILWSFFISGLALLFFILRKPLIKERKPIIKDTILVFLLKAYLSTYIGIFVATEKMIEYPVRFLSKYFETNIIFESFLYPIMCVYFFQTTYHSKFLGIVLQCALYTAALTIIEVLCEKYTDLIKYHTWTWMHSFITIFLLSLFVRMLMQWMNKIDESKA